MMKFGFLSEIETPLTIGVLLIISICTIIYITYTLFVCRAVKSSLKLSPLPACPYDYIKRYERFCDFQTLIAREFNYDIDPTFARCKHFNRIIFTHNAKSRLSVTTHYQINITNHVILFAMTDVYYGARNPRLSEACIIRTNNPKQYTNDNAKYFMEFFINYLKRRAELFQPFTDHHLSIIKFLMKKDEYFPLLENHWSFLLKRANLPLAKKFVDVYRKKHNIPLEQKITLPGFDFSTVIHSKAYKYFQQHLTNKISE